MSIRNLSPLLSRWSSESLLGITSPSVNPLTFMRPLSPCFRASTNRFENSCHCLPSNDFSSLWTKSHTAPTSCKWPSCLSAVNLKSSLFAASLEENSGIEEALQASNANHESAVTVLESWFIPTRREGRLLSAMPLKSIQIPNAFPSQNHSIVLAFLCWLK